MTTVDEVLPKPRVRSVARASSILLLCAESERGLFAKEIADRVGLSRQVTYHLLHTLRSVGLIDKRPDQRFRLGLQVGVLAEGLERQLAPPAHLLPHLRALAAETGEACSVVGWHEGEPVVLAHAPGHHAVRVSDVRTGQSGFAHARASGKLLLALASPEERQSYLSAHALLPRTRATITDVAVLGRELDEVKVAGFAMDNEEFSDGVCCLAVSIPLRNELFAISISAPTDRFRARYDDYMAALRSEAARASAWGTVPHST